MPSCRGATPPLPHPRDPQPPNHPGRHVSGHPHLLAPGRIGPVELRNRIVLAPMGDRLAHDDGTVSERQTAYLEARARGGAALILVGSASVAYPEGSYAPCQTAVSDDRFVAGLSQLADRVHAHGAKIAAQLVHDGANSLLDIAEGRPMLVPSIPPRLRPDALSAMVTDAELAAMTRPFMSTSAALDYRVATEDDLAWLVERFADAAGRAESAGFDGVEIHAGHGYLIDSFLSPALNQRDDEWGGSLDNRARLLVEVIRAVRERVGDRLGVWCRLNAVERFREGGETPDDLVEVAALAVAAGVDAVSVSAATDAGAALGVTEAHTPHEPGLLVPFAARVRATVDVPVITVGRIEPDVAEQVIADGQADFVAMGRKLLADPDLPNKLVAGDIERIRPCIYQYRCIGNIFLNEPVACVANAATAHGDTDLPPATNPRRYLVVGGGPAGVEAARLLASRGHEVTLAEGAPELGGTLVAAGRADPVLAEFVSWMRAEIERSPVELRLSTRVSPELVEEMKVDEVVVAVGGAGADPRYRLRTARGVRGAAEIGAWLESDDGVDRTRPRRAGRRQDRPVDRTGLRRPRPPRHGARAGHRVRGSAGTSRAVPPRARHGAAGRPTPTRRDRDRDRTRRSGVARRRTGPSIEHQRPPSSSHPSSLVQGSPTRSCPPAGRST